jgi:hypothetical protein
MPSYRLTGVARPLASSMLAVIATFLLFPAVVANWARSNVYDRDAFSDHAVQALQDDAVRRALAERIVAEILAVSSPQAVSVRPLIELVTTTVVDSITFREIYRDAVGRVHDDLFGDGVSREPLALTLVDALIVVTAYIRQAYPEAGAQLPTDLTSAFVDLRNEEWAVNVATSGRDVEYLAFVLPALSVVLFAAAVWTSPQRRRTFTGIGFGLIAVAALIVVAKDAGQDALLGRAGVGDRAVNAAIWHAYTNSLDGWAWILGGLGFLVAVVSTNTGSWGGAREQLRRLRQVVVDEPRRPWVRGLHGTALLGAAIFIVADPARALEAGAIVVGAYLAYLGTEELISLAAPSQLRRRPARGHSPQLTQNVIARVASAGLLGAAAVVGAFVTAEQFHRAEGRVQVGRPVGQCNGSADLCDHRLDQVVLLGTHNSMAAASQPGWYFATNYEGIRRQLDSGVRALLIDSWYGYPAPRGVRSVDADFVQSKLPPDEYDASVRAAADRLVTFIGAAPAGTQQGTYLCHAFCELGATPLTQTLQEVNAWLTEHPDEVIVIAIQNQISSEDTAKAFLTSGLINRVFRYTPGQPLPTLREMISQDQRVVVYADNETNGPDWYPKGWDDLVQETPFLAHSPNQLTCAMGRGLQANPLFVLNNWITASPPSPLLAAQVNAFDFLYNRALECERERGKQVNMIVVNFSEVGDAQRVVDVLNGLKRPPEEHTPEAVSSGSPAP